MYHLGTTQQERLTLFFIKNSFKLNLLLKLATIIGITEEKLDHIVGT